MVPGGDVRSSDPHSCIHCLFIMQAGGALVRCLRRRREIVTGLLPWHFGGVKAAKGLIADEEGVSVGHVVGLDGISLFVPFVSFSARVIQVKRGLALPGSSLLHTLRGFEGIVQFYSLGRAEYVKHQ